jgi:hypothetical protein
MTVIESFVAAPMAAITLIDRFAQQRGTRGPMPGPMSPVRFTLVAREVAAVMTPLEVPIELLPKSGISGAYLFADESRIGRSPLYRIVPGKYRLRAESDFYQPLETEIVWPPPVMGMPIYELKPGPGYPFPDVTLAATKLTLIRGTVLRGVAGTPVSGATAEILTPPDLVEGDFTTAASDARGEWVLAIPVGLTEEVEATVRITTPEGDVTEVADLKVLPGTDNSLSQTALRGAVRTAAGAPIANAEITVAGQPDSVFSGRDGAWRFYLSLLQPDVVAEVTAVAPDGPSASRDAQIRNRATVVVPTFRIE